MKKRERPGREVVWIAATEKRKVTGAEERR